MNLKNLKHSLSLKKFCIFNKISKMLPFVITLFYMSMVCNNIRFASRRPKKVPFFGHKKEKENEKNEKIKKSKMK